MAELNDETIVSVLQEKENFDSLLDKSSSPTCSTDALLEKSPLKSSNLRNNLTFDDGSSSDEGAVISVRKRIKRFSDSDSEVDKENKQNRMPDKARKPNISSESEDDTIPRKSRLVADKDSSDDDILSPKNNEVKINEESKPKNKEIKKSKLKSPEKVSKESDFSDSDDDIIRKSRLVYSDSSDENQSKSKQSKLRKKSSIPDISTDSEDEIPGKSRLVYNDSSDDNQTKKSKKSKSTSLKKSSNANVLSDSDDMPQSRLSYQDSSNDDSNARKYKKNKTKSPVESTNQLSDSEDVPQKSGLAANSSDDDITSKESTRISDKRSKLHNKFQGLLKSRSKPESRQKSPLKLEEENDVNSDDSSSGIESIKQKIKQKSMLLKSGICDPDTSSDEESAPKQKQKKKKTSQKSTIMISPQDKPKPARMSAKQAMENMQKIKSESNRMLREKEVSLPYHRPKALSLKDIMNRRRPALSADGKALPVKMNSEQLKQYVKLLEQRNKEMMELCKSESEEEEDANDNPIEDKKEPYLQPDDHNDKEVDDEHIIPQKDDKPDETTVPFVNETENTDENDLPDLTIEIVQKEPDLSKSDVAEKDCSNTDVVKNDLVNTDIENNSPNNDIADKDFTNTDITDKDLSNTDVANIDVSNTNIFDKALPKSVIAENYLLKADNAEKDIDVEMKEVSEQNDSESKPNTKLAAEIESQLMELRYETEKMQNTEDINNHPAADGAKNIDDTDKATNDSVKDISQEDFDDDFDDVDINMEDLESIIENAKDDATAVESPMLIRDPYNLNKKPKLTGAPGMVIDLDGSNPVGPRKLTGVELLKERFTYFAKLKTPEEKERERESTIKPGMQHFKLKQELEEKISEQRSFEWAKRLEELKEQQEEMKEMRGDDSDQEDDLEKIEAKLQEKDVVKESSSESEGDEDVEENDCDMKDKPRKKNPMIDDEAEVSDDEEVRGDQAVGEANAEKTEDADNEDEQSEESSDESSEDEEDNQSKPKKGRILKAFEDSDDESTIVNENPAVSSEVKDAPINSQILKDSQDDLIPLAQTNQSLSEDLFGSQTSNVNNFEKTSDEDVADTTTQTFSILNTNTLEQTTANVSCAPTNIEVICETQPIDATLDDVVGMCSGKFTQTQNLISTESQLTESQCPIGEDILALCTGKFYDNQFVSQVDVPEKELPIDKSTKNENTKKHEEKDLLDSILKEMDEPVEDTNRKKIILDNANENDAVSFDAVNHMKKKFTIDSDDEGNVEASKPGKRKKLKKRKLEKRALQISDDEDEEELVHSDEEFMSEVDEDKAEERIVEYDSEENEVEVKPQKQKKNRKMAEFFENEAELTSEDEWVGSGDEDERGLDRMEREAGDDDTFHQGQLQRELGQIHMRDVLDQDKREVRIIQELLFEDGDLGDGGRQRKFRWRNLDGDEEPGTVPELFAESQEEEFESEEQWRKQRHEREVFLRSLKEKKSEEPNISIDRSTIIKANLYSRTMSSLLMEANGSTKVEETVKLQEVKVQPASARNLPLPVFQQNYHGSLLTRGRGALARLAALAMPLAGEADDQPKPSASGKGNFVFAALTPPAKEAKAPKRKADVNVGTPRLIKKFKTDEQKFPKASLLDHLKAL